jgi:hypothetical protein
MTHTEALNMILANSCPSQVLGLGAEYIIKTHCASFRVYATLQPITPEQGIRYNIVSVEEI